MSKWTRLLAVVLLVCLLFTSCTSAGTPDKKSTDSEYSQEVQNLEKLCKVWGYTKYTHPAFLLGKKDWDEELLKLIPVVSEAKAKEVNDILHEWFVSLGEIDYGTSRPAPKPLESEAVVQADTGWILDETYLGAELSADMQKLGPVSKIDRSKAPVKFSTGQGVPNFKMEKTDVNCSYQTEEERLLGLFRVWNAIEYYFPYLDIMDESWHDLLREFIPKMLQASDKQSFELVICELTSHMHDGHTALIYRKAMYDVFGKYLAPVDLVHTKEGQWVVCNSFNACPDKGYRKIILKIVISPIPTSPISHTKVYAAIPPLNNMISARIL